MGLHIYCMLALPQKGRREPAYFHITKALGKRGVDEPGCRGTLLVMMSLLGPVGVQLRTAAEDLASLMCRQQLALEDVEQGCHQEEKEVLATLISPLRSNNSSVPLLGVFTLTPYSLVFVPWGPATQILNKSHGVLCFLMNAWP